MEDEHAIFRKDAGKGPEKGGSALRWPDYVLRAAALVMLGVFLLRTFGSGDEVKTEAAPEPVVAGDTDERRLPALSTNPEGVWNRVELVLRRLSHLRGAEAATVSDIRTGLKSYQSAIGRPGTGTLDQQTLNRILDEDIQLDPYAVPGAVAHGRWLFERNPEGCRITTAASRIEGRSILTKRPLLDFGRKRKYDNDDTGDTFDVALAKADLFDTASPLSLTAGTAHQMLKFDGTDIIMGDNAEGYPSREVTRTLRFHQGEMVLSGTSAYGGTLKLTFPTEGFESAFRAMAAECGEGILYWIDDWGAIAKDANATVWHAVGHGSEDEAKQKAMAICASKSGAGGCEQYASFKEQCWVLSAGERKKDDWASGWASDSTLDSAKTLALEACANEGGKTCEFITHICSDGSNEWHAPSE